MDLPTPPNAELLCLTSLIALCELLDHTHVVTQVLLPIFNVLDRAEDGQIRISGKDVLSAVGSGFYGTA